MATINEILGKDLAHKSDFLRTATGDLDTIEGLENLKNAYFRRLVTSPGTLIHRPNYGVGLLDFLNGLSSLGNQRLLANRIQEQYEQDPRTEEVLGVRFDVDDYNPEKVLVVVRVRVRGYGELTAEFRPFGEEV